VDDTFAEHPDEPNDNCVSATNLANLQTPVSGWLVPQTPTIYPGSDADYYSLYVLESTDDPFDCIPIVCEERFRLTITLTRPPDGQDFELCASGSACGSQTCTAGVRELTWSGTCGGDDDRMVYFSVRSPSSESFDCHDYELQIDSEAWLVGEMCPGAR